MRAIDAEEMLNRLEEWNTDDPTDKALYNFAWNRIIEQPTIELRCEDCENFSKTRLLICEYGKQDEVGRWFCWGLGCQIGDEDGSGYCADAERRTDGV